LGNQSSPALGRQLIVPSCSEPEMKEKYQIVTESLKTVETQITALLGEGKAVQEHLLSLLCKELEAMNRIDGKTPINEALKQATMLLASRFHSDAQSGLRLLCSGHILQASVMERDMVEVVVLIQYLQLHPKEADAFMQTKSLRQRKRFSLPKVWKTIPNGQSYKDQFDIASASAHPSSVGLGLALRPNQKADTKLFIGPFYQPFPTVMVFQAIMASTLETVVLLHKWYRSSAAWPLNSSELRILKKAILAHLTRLRSEAEKQDSELEDTLLFLKGRSPEQVEAMWNKMNETVTCLSKG
jgi:hypothetical protein